MTHTKGICSAGLALAAGILIPVPALAVAPPALPLTEFHLSAQSTFLETAGTVQSGVFFAQGGTSSSGPELSVHGVGVTSNVTAENEASATALWSFQLLGPLNVAVPIVISGLYGASADDVLGVAGGVALGVDRFRLDRVLSFRCGASDRSGCDSSRGGLEQDFAIHTAALSGYETFAQITLGGSVRGLPGVLGGFSGNIDPLISIDPTFDRTSEFTLIVSADAGGGVPAVPEPSTWLMMLVGCAVSCACLRAARGARIT